MNHTCAGARDSLQEGIELAPEGQQMLLLANDAAVRRYGLELNNISATGMGNHTGMGLGNSNTSYLKRTRPASTLSSSWGTLVNYGFPHHRFSRAMFCPLSTRVADWMVTATTCHSPVRIGSLGYSRRGEVSVGAVYKAHSIYHCA